MTVERCGRCLATLSRGAVGAPWVRWARHQTAGVHLPVFICRCSSAGVYLPVFICRCSSAGVYLPVFICRCSSAGVHLPVFICRCEGGGAGRSDPAAAAGAHQVCCRGALPRCAAWLPARARSCSSGTQGRTQRELPSPWLGRCRKARGSLLPGVLKKYGHPSSSRSTHVACTGRRKQRRTEEAFVFA